MNGFYPHTAFTYCSSANRLGFDVKKAFNKLTEEFTKGYVTYPRSDGEGHGEIKILNPGAVSDEIKNIFRTPPILKRERESVTGDVYTLAGELYLSTPASLVGDVELAKKTEPPQKADIYIGIRRKEFLESEALYVDTKNASMDVLKNVFEKDLAKSKTKIPAYNKEKESMSLRIA
jgi:hypothetical protein